MAIEVNKKAGVFHHIALPFDVIIGDRLHYGNAEDYVQTMDGETTTLKAIQPWISTPVSAYR